MMESTTSSKLLEGSATPPWNRTVPSPPIRPLEGSSGGDGTMVEGRGSDGGASGRGGQGEILFDVLVNTFEMSAVKRPMGMRGET